MNCMFFVIYYRLRVGEDGGKVDISDLTWEQKEQILKLLFSKMNQSAMSSKKPLPPPTHTHPLLSRGSHTPQARASSPVFITQSNGAEATVAPAHVHSQRMVAAGQAA